MNSYIIFLLLTNAVSADKLTCETTVKTQIKDVHNVEWTALPLVEKDGATYYRLVVSESHLARSCGVKTSDVTADKFAPMAVKGLTVLYGVDWKAAQDKAGYKDVVPKTDPKTEEK